jgi:hypothetical protein
VGATYQWCMQSCFKGQIECNLEVYIDDITVETWQSNSLIADLEETFGVPRGKPLGTNSFRWMDEITKRGIEANPNKFSGIAEIGQVKNIKDV